jgi:hypothetical protein
MILKSRYSLILSSLFVFASSSPSQSNTILYHKHETDHFIIQYSESDSMISRHVAEESEKLRIKIVSDVGYFPKEKTTIVLAPSLEEFQQIQPNLKKIPLWAAAVAYPELNLMIIRSPKAIKDGHLDYQKVFIHEFTHIVMGRALQNKRAPTFLTEGISMYESSEWHFSRMASLTKAALTGRIIPLRKLTDQFPEDQDDADLAYAESFMFISFLINKYGRESFQQFIKNYAESGNLRQSLHEMTGKHLVTLEREWIDYMKLRVSWIPLITSATTFWFIVTVIFIYSYYRKRKRASIILLQWEEEDKNELAGPDNRK